MNSSKMFRLYAHSSHSPPVRTSTHSKLTLVQCDRSTDSSSGQPFLYLWREILLQLNDPNIYVHIQIYVYIIYIYRYEIIMLWCS